MLRQEEDACRDVAQRILQCEADGQAGGADNRQNRGRVDAEKLQNDEQSESHGYQREYSVDDADERDIQCIFFGCLAESLVDQFVNKIGDDQDDCRQQDDFAEMEDVAFERIPHFLPDGSDIALGKLFKDGFCLERGGLEGFFCFDGFCFGHDESPFL